jgi:hypothetical protein
MSEVSWLIPHPYQLYFRKRLSDPLSSLSDLKEIGCKSVWPVHISPLFRPIE